ncbi:hypothetical protein DSM112329_03024 [Paraconexibacter sp. AEG42_29]|uniref:O-antigen ligase-related domain-containing protein n=1 Tax=Paraconexibacter sp. AEG42_29 TaxID=2997339 RepID=A0AAU7AWZ9_9ACTN
MGLTLRAGGSPRPARGLPTVAVFALSLLAAAVAAGSVAAAPENPLVPVALVGGALLFCVAVLRPLAVVCLGVLAIPLEGYFPGLVGPSQALLGLAALGWLIGWASSPPVALPRHPALGGFLVLMAVILLGMAFAPEPAVVGRQLATWGALLIVAGAIAHSANAKGVELILIAVAVAGGLAGAIAVVDPQPLVGAVFLGTDVNRATGGLGSPNALGMLLGLTVPIQIVLALRAPTLELRILGAGCAALALAGMALSVSRGAFIGLAAAFLVLAFWDPFRRTLLIAVPLLITLTIVGSNPATPIGSNVVDRLSGTTQNASSNPRLDLWRKTPAIIEDHPFFGIGALEFTHYAPQYDLETREGIPNHAHNLLLTMTAETGVVGLAAFLFMYAAVARALLAVIRLGSGLERGFAFALAASFVAFFVNGILDYALGAAPLAAAFFVLVGCAVGLRVNLDSGPRDVVVAPS